MSFYPTGILRRRWTAVGAIESIPAHSSRLQYHQTKSLVRGLPFFWESLNPHTHIVTSNMLLWGFRHIFLMFYTPYNLHCAERRILLADIIDGACDPAGVKLAERFLSPRRHCKNTHRHRQTCAHTHTHTHSEPILRSGNEPNLISDMPQFWTTRFKIEHTPAHMRTIFMTYMMLQKCQFWVHFFFLG